MNLLDIRKKVVGLSGRFDLVVNTTAYADNGADFFIQEGSKLLDRLSPDVNGEDSAFFPVAEGAYFQSLTNARVVKEVWFYTSEGRYKLREIKKDRIKEIFAGVLTGDTKGIPAIYAPVKARKIKGTSPSDFLTGLVVTSTDLNGVMFSPVSPAGTLEVVGKFYSEDILEEEENYWSRHHGMLLVWASLYMLETSYRNSEGARDWMQAINEHIVGLDMDYVEEVSENLKQLGGRENE